MTDPCEPQLGCATTHEIIEELIVRFEMAQLNDLGIEVRGRLMAMTKNLEFCLNFFGPAILEHRTVDS